MFNAHQIYTNPSGTRFLCICPCNSAQTAKYIEASFLMSVREFYRLADLYAKGSTLILDTPNKEMTIALVSLLNKAISTMH